MQWVFEQCLTTAVNYSHIEAAVPEGRVKHNWLHSFSVHIWDDQCNYAQICLHRNVLLFCKVKCSVWVCAGWISCFWIKKCCFSLQRDFFHQAHTFLCLVLTFVLIFLFIYLWKLSMFRSYKERRLLNCLLSVQYFIAGLKSDYVSLRA